MLSTCVPSCSWVAVCLSSSLQHLSWLLRKCPVVHCNSLPASLDARERLPSRPANLHLEFSAVLRRTASMFDTGCAATPGAWCTRTLHRTPGAEPDFDTSYSLPLCSCHVPSDDNANQ
ncbi:hypothetical protein OH76DRAFT_771473 [Lentinus brumalis]|uniref:Uncharacterized protein n=1 Tax=Lentinus brumalis TaxID=2498619 RepID=A0A371D4S5_9APHY|nr:hypothetical protein OH76DRAFT_771473 [Polyporus brumalis]